MHSFALVVALTLAAAPDANGTYEKLKALEGTWKTDAKAGPVQFVTLRFVGAGSSLLETTTGTDRGTVNSAVVYSFEGPKLVLMHYGAGGTSKLDLAPSEAGIIKFESTAKDARVANVTLTIKDNKLKQEWTVREGGKDVKKTVELLREYVDTLK